MRLIVAPEQTDAILGIIPNNYTVDEAFAFKRRIEDYYGFPCSIETLPIPLNQVLDLPLSPL